jgi:hypothetical protein
MTACYADCYLDEAAIHNAVMSQTFAAAAAAAAGFLPTGWEMGYNHYVGRLGMRLPETAAMLARSWPEWQVSPRYGLCVCPFLFLFFSWLGPEGLPYTTVSPDP